MGEGGEEGRGEKGGMKGHTHTKDIMKPIHQTCVIHVPYMCHTCAIHVPYMCHMCHTYATLSNIGGACTYTYQGLTQDLIKPGWGGGGVSINN